MSDKFIEKKKKARQFCQDVEKLAEEYDLPFFVVTDGASAIVNNGCLAVKNARESHILWEKQHGLNPYENWKDER